MCHSGGVSKQDLCHANWPVISVPGLGRVKTPTFNQRIEIPSRFRQFENQKCCDYYQKKTIEKPILRIFGACTFLRSQH
jgi:hypothetical protein